MTTDAVLSATSPRPPPPAERPVPRLPGVPVLGNLPAYARDPLAFLARTARRHGDVVELAFPGGATYLVSRPDLIESVLVGENKNFIKDKFTHELKALLGDGLLTSDGDFWRRQRRLAQPAFHRDRIHAYAAQMVASTEALLAAWRPGETRDLHEDMMRLTLDIVSRTLFSADVGGSAGEVGAAMEDIMAYYADPVVAAFPAVTKLPLPRFTRFRAAVIRLDAIIYGIVRKRREAGAGDTGDLLSMLLAARDDDGSAMSDRQLRDECMTLFLAGHETTALALSWSFHLLSQHPETLVALQAELDAALGGRTPTLEDVPRLRYADAVVHETMRLYPPAWSLGREAVAPFTLDGHRIPAGAQVWMSTWIVHRDGRYYDAPDAFRPERWLDGLAKRLPRFAYFPFGGGPRLCIGNAFALLEATLLLATVAQRYELQSVPGARVEAFPAITLRLKHGLPMRLVARAGARG